MGKRVNSAAPEAHVIFILLIPPQNEAFRSKIAVQMTKTIMVVIPLLCENVCSFVATLTESGC